MSRFFNYISKFLAVALIGPGLGQVLPPQVDCQCQCQLTPHPGIGSTEAPIGTSESQCSLLLNQTDFARAVDGRVIFIASWDYSS